MSDRRNKQILVVAVLSLVLFFLSINHSGFCQVANAEDNRGVTLEANIEKQEITLQSIRDFRLDLKRIKQAASDIFDEVTRQPISYQSTPNVVGTLVINVPVSISEPGLLEPRRDWIVHCVDKMGPIVELLRKDAESIGHRESRPHFSATTEKELDQLTDSWVTMVKDMHKQYRALLPLIKDNPVNNRSMAARSRSIFLSAGALEKTRSKAEKLVKNDLKRQKKEERSAKKKAKVKN